MKLDSDKPRDGQLTEVKPRAEPWLEKLLRFGLGERMHGLDVGRFRGDCDGFGDKAFHIIAGPRLHLDRRLAQHIRTPGLRSVGDQQRRASGQAREKGHDRDDDNQRPPGDGVPRYERRIGLERRFRFHGENRLDDRFVHDGNPSKIVSLLSPTTSRRAKPNWSMSWRSCVAITTAVPRR